MSQAGNFRKRKLSLYYYLQSKDCTFNKPIQYKLFISTIADFNKNIYESNMERRSNCRKQ